MADDSDVRVLRTQIEDCKMELQRLQVQLDQWSRSPPAMQQSQSASASDNPSPPRAPGMASISEVTAAMKQRQRGDPSKWTMTIEQWLAVLSHCKTLPEYQVLRKQKRFVSMYDLTETFSKPWTKGTCCGVAILMSQLVEQSAQLMISHAWGEDMEELIESLVTYCQQNQIPHTAFCWFCVFRCN